MSWRKNSARNFQFDRPSTPYNVGPGSYDVEPTPRKRRAPSAAFKNREKRTTPFDKAKFRTPAPGKYDPFEADRHIKITSSFKTNSARRFYDPTDNPSPADHSNLHEWITPRPRNHTDSVLDRPFSPNVGQDISGFDILEDGTLRPKKVKKRDDRWLGPGSYNIEYAYGVGGHSMKEPYRNCDPSSRAGVPGPGAYDTRPQQFRSPKNPMHKRAASVKGARGPKKDPSDSAPKSGELKHQPWNRDEYDISSPSFKSRTKREIFVVKEKTPDPTNYQNTERKRPTSAKAAFGQRTPRFIDYNGNDVPGPGAYEAEDCMWITSTTPTGRHAYDVYKPGNGVPGPGTYEAPTIWGKKPEKQNSVFASSVPRDRQVGDVTPGPGTYATVDTPRSKSKISIHSSRSKKTNNFFEIPTKANPAPDQYNADRSIGKKGRTIPKDSRFEKESRSPTPGPGTYKVEHDTLVKKSYNSDLIGMVAE